MHIISIGLNNYYQNIFNNTLPVKYNNFSFGRKAQNPDGSASQLFNAMSEIKEKGEKTTKKQLSDKTGIPLSSIYMCVNKSSQLQELFAQINSSAAKNSKSEPKNNTRKKQSYFDKKEKSLERQQRDIEIKAQKEQIRAILKEAIEKQEKLTFSQIAQITGLNPTNVQSRIICDKTLHDMFSQVMLHKSNQYSDDEKKNQVQQIWNILLDAYNSNSYITDNEIASIVGINEATVKRRIDSEEQLKILWTTVCNMRTSLKNQERIKIENEIIKSVLEQAKASHVKIVAEQISLLTNISIANVRKRVLNDAELSYIYSLIKVYPPLASETQVIDEDAPENLSEGISASKKDAILKIFIEAKEKQRPISYQNLINDTSATIQEVYTVLEQYEKSEQKAKSQVSDDNQAQNSKENETEIKDNVKKNKPARTILSAKDRAIKVIKMILDAKKYDRQISYRTIINATGATKEEIDKIISDYSKQKAEYKRKIEIENAKALETLRRKESEQETLFDYQEIKTKPSTAGASVVTSTQKTDEPINISDNQYLIIDKMLNKAQNKGYRVSLASIAKHIKSDEKTAYRAIKSRPDLLNIWQKVKAPETLNSNDDND